MGSYRRDRHTASRNSAGSTTERAPAAMRRFEALPDPAPRCGENSRPGKVHHRLKDSREAILWFHDTRLSSVSDAVFGSRVANRANRVAKCLALAPDELGCFRSGALWSVLIGLKLPGEDGG